MYLGEGNIKKIYGPVAEQGMWRIRNNRELSGLHSDQDITADVTKERLEWIGHVVRMDKGRPVKKILEMKPEGSRKRGRPRLRRLEDVEKDRPEMATESS